MKVIGLKFNLIIFTKIIKHNIINLLLIGNNKPNRIEPNMQTANQFPQIYITSFSESNTHFPESHPLHNDLSVTNINNSFCVAVVLAFLAERNLPTVTLVNTISAGYNEYMTLQFQSESDIADFDKNTSFDLTDTDFNTRLDNLQFLIYTDFSELNTFDLDPFDF